MYGSWRRRDRRRRWGRCRRGQRRQGLGRRGRIGAGGLNGVGDALKEFEASFMAGFSHFDKMDQDPDLDGLRKDARFTELVAQYRNAPAR